MANKPRRHYLSSVVPDAKKAAEAFLFIVCDYFDPLPREAKFSLVAPGMDGLDIMQGELLDWLRNSLPNSSLVLMHGIDINEHPRTGELEFTIPLDDTYTTADKLAHAVYQMTAGHLVPFAAEHYREVVLLRRNQRLVPLTFYLTDYGSTLHVKVPDGLEFRRPNRPTKRYPRKAHRRGRAFLEHALEMALDSWGSIKSVGLFRIETDGALIELRFDSPLLVDSLSAEDIRDAILSVLGRHCLAPGDGGDTKLLFSGAYQEDPERRLC